MTNKPDLFSTPFSFKALMKTDHLGVVLPPGLKLKPVRTKVTFRDYREHRKILFENRIQAYDWSEVFNATDIDVATNLIL